MNFLAAYGFTLLEFDLQCVCMDLFDLSAIYMDSQTFGRHSQAWIPCGLWHPVTASCGPRVLSSTSGLKAGRLAGLLDGGLAGWMNGGGGRHLCIHTPSTHRRVGDFCT